MATEKTNRRSPQPPRPGAALQPKPLLPALPGKGTAHLRNANYLRFLRTRPCSFCGREGTEAHHVFKHFRGISTAAIGRKGSDYLAISICRGCHNKIHTGSFRPDRTELLELIIINVVSFVLSLGPIDRQSRGLQG